jgi:hypothetical protein
MEARSKGKGKGNNWGCGRPLPKHTMKGPSVPPVSKYKGKGKDKGNDTDKGAGGKGAGGKDKDKGETAAAAWVAWVACCRAAWVERHFQELIRGIADDIERQIR